MSTAIAFPNDGDRPKRRLSAAASKELSEEIKSGLALTEKKIRKFIDGQGWIGCGYDTFYSWWDKELSGLSLAREIRPHIMYEMFAEGKKDEEVAVAIKGVGGEAIKSQRERFNQGLPPSLVEIRPYVRQEASETKGCRVEFQSNAEYKRAVEIANSNGTTLSEWARRRVLGLS